MNERQEIKPEVRTADEIKREKRKQARRNRDELLRSLGLTKVRGCVSGETYWE
jgi:hypothetical protein